MTKNETSFTKNLVLSLMILASLAFIDSTSSAGPIIVDHTCTYLSQIPDEWIDAVQANIKWHYAHTSHGKQLTIGLQRREDAYSKYSVATGKMSLPVEPGALCIFDGQEHTQAVYPEDYWDSEAGRQYTQNVLNHNPTINVSMWSWCWQLSTYSEEQVQNYLNTLAAFEESNPWVTFVYFTGTTEPPKFNRYLRNNQIRSWVRDYPDKNRILFDFADLDSWWFNPNTQKWEQATASVWNGDEYVLIPAEHPQFHGNEAGHTTYESCEQKGRAVWWMMARIVGWSPSGGDNQPPTTDAGPDQTVNEGDTVTLDGSSSSDPDDGIASYLWTQTAGASVTLSDATAAMPTFVTPPVDATGTVLTFLLEVTDSGGLQATDEVSVIITDSDIPGISTFITSKNRTIGIKIDGAENIKGLSAVDPATANTKNKPSNLIYGLIDIQLDTTPGATATVTIYLPTSASDDYTWFIYSSTNGWSNFSANAVFNDTRDRVTLTLIDGGIGDNDGATNEVIVNLSGLGTPPSDSGGTSSEGSSSGGCFISTTSLWLLGGAATHGSV